MERFFLFLTAVAALAAVNVAGQQLVAPEMTNACFSDPSSSSCNSFYLTQEEAMLDIVSLCWWNATNALGRPTSMPYMVGCELAAACGFDLEPTTIMISGESEGYAIASAEQDVETQLYQGYQGNTTLPQCDPFTILATLCHDMPGMSACKQYTTLCAPETVVQQCLEFPPLSNNVTDISTHMTWDNVQYLCGFHAVHLNRTFNGTISSAPQGSMDTDTDTDMDMGMGNGDMDHSMHGRRLLHEGHNHGTRPTDGVPHGPEEHAVCNQCYKTADNVMLMETECPKPFQSYSNLCGSSPDGTGDPAYEAYCNTWMNFCELNQEAFPSFCSAMAE